MITAEEIILIKKIKEKISTKKNNWARLLYQLVHDKRNDGMPFDEITEWLKENGLEITIEKVSWNYWNYTKKLSKKKQKLSIIPQNKGKPVIENTFDPEQRNTEIIKEIKNRNSGLDQISNM